MVVCNTNESAGGYGKTKIPVYKQSAKCEKKKQYKKDSKFIEIIHYGESIFVRKITLAWLQSSGRRKIMDWSHVPGQGQTTVCFTKHVWPEKKTLICLQKVEKFH